MGVYAELRGLQILSQTLDLAENGVPLGQQSSSGFRRTSASKALDLRVQDAPVTGRLAQDRIQSLRALLKTLQEISVKFVDFVPARLRLRWDASHRSSVSCLVFPLSPGQYYLSSVLCGAIDELMRSPV